MQREKGKEPLREAVKRLDERLWHQLEEVWRLAEAGIQDAQKSRDGHQQGTPHCLAVEANLAALIPDDWKGERFTATDLFVLSAAAALHDAGKASDSPDDHGHVSMWEMRDRPADFGLDRGQVIAVGWIVRAHNDGNLEALPQGPVSLGVAEVNVRPLAALFKLADALHTDYRRISRQVVELGGEKAEDNPKTHFRMLVTGWRFDEQGQIVLEAVPKDWDDAPVIHTGFEMTRRELELVVPTLQDAGFPWELTLYPVETDLERKAGLEFEAERRVEWAFVGMDYFTEADASRFKGRDDDAQALWHRVMAVPLTLLVGDSGVGKTSLIHAGLFPLLHQAGWRTCCTRPFDDPDRSIVRDLWRGLLEGKPPADVTIVETLGRACKAVGACKLLVVLDQFEDVVRVPLPEMLDGLRKALVAVQAERFRNLRLLVSYRADAEASLGPLFQEIVGSDRGLPRTYLQPLSRAGAQAALEAGFTEAQVAVNDTLLNAIADALEAQTPLAGVYPPYVQMVGETLCQVARKEGEGILTEELYRTQGGCAGIIGHYLFQRLAEFGEREGAARKVLVALVRSTGIKGHRSAEEIGAETGLATEPLMQLLADLVDKRMIRHLGGGQYEIVHDHLAQLVDREIVSNEERQLKELREFLDLKARAYATSHIPLQPADMARLYVVRQHITPTDDQLRLLLHSCLLEQGPAWFWLRTAPADRYLPLLREWQKEQKQRRWEELHEEVAQMFQALRKTERQAIPDLWKLLKDQNRNVQAVPMPALFQEARWETIHDLRQLLKDQDQRVEPGAAQALTQALQQMRDEAIPNLRELLKDCDRNVRMVAVQVLAHEAGREAISDLQKLLKDQDWNVRMAAAQALIQILEQIGWQPSQYLQEFLESQNWYVLGAEAQALVQILGQMRRETIPILRELLKDKIVREAAVQALEEMITEDDLEWLAEWVIRYPLSETSEAANHLLIHLDRKLYCPFDWPEM